MSLCRFSKTAPSQASQVPPLYGIGAVVHDRLTGTLRIQTDRAIRLFHFNAGVCTHSLSNVKGELPADFLVREGKNSPAPLSLDSQEKDKYSVFLGAILASAPRSEIAFQPGPSPTSAPGTLHALRLLISVTLSLRSPALESLFEEYRKDSVVGVDLKLEKSLEPLPLDPEERGLLTVAKNSKTIAEIFESSFLKHEKIHSLLLAYWTCGLLTLENAQRVRQKSYEAGLSPAEHALRKAVRAFVLGLSHTNYYQWLQVHPGSSSAEIRKQATALLERYSNPSIERAFADEQREDLPKTLSAIREAMSVLLHPEKRTEYNRHLAGGGTGSIVGQSSVVRVEATLAEAQAKIDTGNIAEAVLLYETALGGAVAPARIVIAYAQVLLALDGPKNTGNRDKAFAQLKRALSLTPEDPALFAVIGEWCEAIHQTEKAFEAYQRALQLDPTFLATRQALLRLKPDVAPKAILAAIHRNLKNLNHYQLLGVGPQASRNEIHAAYRDLSKQFHPDRFFQNEDLELRNLSKETYKRMIDAFMVLKDPARRKAYDQTLLVVPGVKVGGVTDRQPDISDPHSIGPTTQQGRKFYDLALAALRERRLETAKFNLELALQAEPGNRAIQEKLNEISRYPR